MEIGAAEFTRFYGENLTARHVKHIYAPLEIAQALIEEGCARGQVRVLAARRKDAAKTTRYDAAVACAWDDERCYFCLSTRRIRPRIVRTTNRIRMQSSCWL
jgi:hypothetical protein